MNLPNLSDTIAAIATPPGMGAIAVLRLSGPRAFAVADALFVGKRLSEQATHTAHFGRLFDPLDGDEGRIIDEVLVTIFRAPRSYTGDDIVEISCHGSTYIQQAVLQALLRHGARLATPGEFTLRAFLNGKLDLSQAEAVADLINSESEASAKVALQQLRGGFKNEIAQLRAELIHFASMVELELDFSEEDVEFADRSQLKALVDKIRSYLQSLLRSFSLGNALKTGVVTVIAGRPNAGKSTLLNALLNEERAIVSDIAGTTRDTIEEILNINGVRFRLIDTAGIREAQDTIEQMGVARTLEKIRQATLLVYVWDVASGMTLADVWEDVARLCPTDANEAQIGHQLLIVCNKMDRNPLFHTDWLRNPAAPEVHPYLMPTEGFEAPDSTRQILSEAAILPVSAKNLMNIEYLKEQLFERAVGESTQTDQTILTNARHHDALLRADQALADVLQGLESGITGDFIAQDIRRSLNYLGEISGEIGVEDLLGEIFGSFCIGK